LGTDGKADGKNNIFLFTKSVLNMRKGSAALRQGNYSMPISFAKNDGSGGYSAYADRCVRIHMDGSAVGSVDWLLFVNMYTATVPFTAPAADAGMKWVRVIDTASWAESENNAWDPATAWTLSGTYSVLPGPSQSSSL
jgi:glycogen operon protein